MAQSIDDVLACIQLAKDALEGIARPAPEDHARWSVYNRVRNAVDQLGLAREVATCIDPVRLEPAGLANPAQLVTDPFRKETFRVEDGGLKPLKGE